MSFPKIDLSERPQRRTLDAVTMSLGLSIVLASMLFVGYGWRLDASVQRMQNEIATEDQALQQLRARTAGVFERARRESRTMTSEIDQIKQLKNDPVRYANLLWELGEIIPANCYISNLQIDPASHSVVLAGVATSAHGAQPVQAVAQTMKNFSGSRYFTEPTLSSAAASTTNGAPSWTFSITARYDEQAAYKSPDEISPRH